MLRRASAPSSSWWTSRRRTQSQRRPSRPGTRCSRRTCASPPRRAFRAACSVSASAARVQRDILRGSRGRSGFLLRCGAAKTRALTPCAGQRRPSGAGRPHAAPRSRVPQGLRRNAVLRGGSEHSPGGCAGAACASTSTSFRPRRSAATPWASSDACSQSTRCIPHPVLTGRAASITRY
jgi:hypothetical protein